VRTAAAKIGRPDEVSQAVARAHAAGVRVAVACGRFPILHDPWVRALAAAKAAAERLVVIVTADRTAVPLLPDEDRALLVAALRDVDHVLVAYVTDVPSLLLRLRPDVYFPCAAAALPDEAEVVQGYGGRIVSSGDLEGETGRLLERLRK
jgi:bifunctional ADP-heptose synthase (sugar kinase/adenylyltransferase)